jgi:hypothetical protein
MPSTNNLMSPSSFLVGRESELAAFAAVLERAKPSVVLITGIPGTGKAALLQAFEKMAREKGWRTTLRSDQRFLSVTSPMDEYQFYSQVRECFALPGQTMLNQTRLTAVSDVMAQLAPWSPLLLLIDQYDPPPDFDKWFMTTFIETLRKSQEPFVLVISELPHRVAALQGKQNEFFALSPLTREEVQAHLASLGDEISPPLESVEMDVYVDAILQNPDLLSKLYRVLSLARSGETTSAGIQ